jgi:hypothetical protein
MMDRGDNGDSYNQTRRPPASTNRGSTVLVLLLSIIEAGVTES